MQSIRYRFFGVEDLLYGPLCGQFLIIFPYVLRNTLVFQLLGMSFYLGPSDRSLSQRVLNIRIVNDTHCCVVYQMGGTNLPCNQQCMRVPILLRLYQHCMLLFNLKIILFANLMIHNFRDYI